MSRFVVLFAPLLAASCNAGIFACDEDDDCVSGAVQGMCTAEGVCAFPDADCESGQRYGSHGGALGGHCVPVPATTSGAETSTTTTHEPSTTSAAPTTTSSSSSDPMPGTTSSSGGEASSSDASTGMPQPIEPLVWLQFPGDDPGRNDGTLGGATLCDPNCPDTFDGIAYFGGANQCITFASDLTLETGPLTATLWVWPNQIEPAGLVGKAFDANLDSWSVVLRGFGAPTLRAAMDGVPPAILDTEAPSTNDWTHVALVWTGDALTLFVNAMDVGTAPSSMPPFDGTPVRIGCESGDGLTHFLDGQLADIRVYGRALEADELAGLAAMTPPMPD